MKQRTRPMRAASTERAIQQPSTCERTAVIILSQVVVIVALLVAWSIIRSRRNQA